VILALGVACRGARWQIGVLVVAASVALVLAAGGVAGGSLTLPGDIVAEATGPDGAIVTYTASAANPAGKPRTVTCDGPEGVKAAGTWTVTATFPLGETVVTCQATSGGGEVVGSGSFTITVKDTTPPILIVPPPVTVQATTNLGVAASNPVVEAFLAGARAKDIADPVPAISNDAPPVFPVGTTRVTFTATDQSGNTVAASASLTVLAPARGAPSPPSNPSPPGSPSPPASPSPPSQIPLRDTVPPRDVSGLAAVARDRKVLLRWRLPPDPDFDHVTVTRTSADGSPLRLYTGNNTSFTDRAVVNGTQYRYLVAAYDRAGNHSTGVAVSASPHRIMLLAPRDGRVVKTPPLLAWVAVRDATYYNVQLFRDGRKVLSAWPKKNRLRLPRRWSFAGTRMRLSHGTYRWYVWPGFGARREARYGGMLGESTFIVR
jgi:hypothetical protein